MILPSLAKDFHWTQTPCGPALACDIVETLARHFFTTRGWRLGAATPEPMGEAWGDVARAADTPAERLVRVHQVHGAAVFTSPTGRTNDAQTGALPEATIIISGDSSHALVIQTADCVPLLIVDRRTGAIAAAHAGWRGLANRRPACRCCGAGAGVRQPAGRSSAVGGPSIGACC